MNFKIIEVLTHTLTSQFCISIIQESFTVLSLIERLFTHISSNLQEEFFTGNTSRLHKAKYTPPRLGSQEKAQTGVGPEDGPDNIPKLNRKIRTAKSSDLKSHNASLLTQKVYRSDRRQIRYIGSTAIINSNRRILYCATLSQNPTRHTSLYANIFTGYEPNAEEEISLSVYKNKTQSNRYITKNKKHKLPLACRILDRRPTVDLQRQTRNTTDPRRSRGVQNIWSGNTKSDTGWLGPKTTVTQSARQHRPTAGQTKEEGRQRVPARDATARTVHQTSNHNRNHKKPQSTATEPHDVHNPLEFTLTA